MNKILKMVGTASLVGSMLVFAGCGGGGGSDDDNGTVTPPTTVTTEVTATGTSTATAAKDIYKFAANDGINFTITGFAAGDVLSFPVGPTSLTVENGAFDDKAVVKWVSNGKEVRATLAGLTDAVDRKLTSIDAFNAEFGAGTIASY